MKSTLERRGEFLCFYWMLHVSGFRMKSWIWDKRSEVHLQLPNFCGLSLWFFYFFLVKSNLAFSFFLYISSLSLFPTVECGTFIPALWRLAVLLSTTWRYSWQICLSFVAQSTSSFVFFPAHSKLLYWLCLMFEQELRLMFSSWLSFIMVFLPPIF